MLTINQVIISLPSKANFAGFLILFLILQISINMMGPLIKNYTNWYSKRPRTTAYIDSMLKVIITSTLIFLFGTWILFKHVFWKTFLVIFIFELIYEIGINVICGRKNLFVNNNYERLILQEKLLISRWKNAFNILRYCINIIIPIILGIVIYFLLYSRAITEYPLALKRIAIVIIISASINDLLNFIIDFVYIFSSRITNSDRSIYFNFGTLGIYRAVFIAFFAMQVNGLNLYENLCGRCQQPFYILYTIIIATFIVFGLMFTSFSHGQNKQLSRKIDYLNTMSQFIFRTTRAFTKEEFEEIIDDIYEEMNVVEDGKYHFKPLKNVPEEKFEEISNSLNRCFYEQIEELTNLKNIIIESKFKVNEYLESKLEITELKNDIKIVKCHNEKVTPVRIVVVLSALTTFAGMIGFTFDIIYESIKVIIS